MAKTSAEVGITEGSGRAIGIAAASSAHAGSRLIAIALVSVGATEDWIAGTTRGAASLGIVVAAWITDYSSR
jgi:hypothetical protein